MSIDPEELVAEEPQEPIAHVRIVYTGPVAPHWDIQALAGDENAVDEFRQRAMARLQLLPPHDPQFRRNRERVNRDAERELIALEWDLGYDEEEGDATALGDKPAVEGEPAVDGGAPEAAVEGTADEGTADEGTADEPDAASVPEAAAEGEAREDG